MQKKTQGVGDEKFRVAIDAIGCRFHTLEAVNDFIIGLATTIKVKIRSLTLLEVPSLHTDQPPGILASVLYLESSMMLHVSPEREEVSLDIFLHREIDVAPVVRALEYFYRPTHVNVDIKRSFNTSLLSENSKNRGG